jgi:hypothetical protein
LLTPRRRRGRDRSGRSPRPPGRWSRGAACTSSRAGSTIRGRRSLAFSARRAGALVGRGPRLLEDLGLLPGHPFAGRRREPPVIADRRRRPYQRSAGRRAVASASGPYLSGQLVAVTGLAGATVLGVLTALEIRGLVVEGSVAIGPAEACRGAGGHAGRCASRRRWRPKEPSLSAHDHQRDICRNSDDDPMQRGTAHGDTLHHNSVADSQGRVPPPPTRTPPRWQPRGRCWRNVLRKLGAAMVAVPPAGHAPAVAAPTVEP